MSPLKKLLVCATLAFLLTATIILSLDLLSARADNSAVTDAIRAALRTGSAVFPPKYDRNLKTGIDTYTDCLVLSIATYGQKDPISAVTRSNHVAGPEDVHPCADLNAKLGDTPIQGQTRTVDYWRYWWGSAALLNIAIGLGRLGLPAYQQGLKATTYAGLFLTLCIALARYRRAALPFLPVAAALIFAFAIPLFGQSIAHAPGLLIGLLLISAYMVTGMDRTPFRWQFVYFFIAGGVGFYFDLLNGDILAILICFALLRLLSVYAVGPSRVFGPGLLARLPGTTAVIHAMVSYVAGAVSMAIFRIILHAIFTQQGLFDALYEWAIQQLGKYSTSNLHRLSKPLTEYLVDWYHDVDTATFPYMGRYLILFIYLCCSVIYIAMSIWWLRNRSKLSIMQRDVLYSSCLIVSIVPIWFCLFFTHTVIHHSMMGRLLSLFLSLAPSIAILLALTQLNRGAGPHRVTS